jgi:hypothetical protein
MTLDDELKLNKAIYDADQANLVLENEQFKRAFAMIQQEIIDQWKQSPVRDQEGREKLWSLYMLSQKLENSLKATLATGKLASKEMEYQRSLPQKVKEFIGWA